MKNIIRFQPLTPNGHKKYIEVGTKAYNQHYRHLWHHGDSSPYINTSFTSSILKEEEKDDNTILFLIQYQKNTVGIFKITMDNALDDYPANTSLHINKIYILKEYTGMGIGNKVLDFIQLRAKELNKKTIWLSAMQKGPALPFYQKKGYTVYRETTLPFANAVEAEKPMYLLLKEI